MVHSPEIRSCSLCAQSLAKAIVVGVTSRGGRECRRVACAICGLVQHAELPTEAELSAYYEESYRQEHGLLPMYVNGAVVAPGHPKYGEALQARATARAQIVIDACAPRASDILLEMGAGDCSVAQAVAAASGCLVVAVEPDPSVRPKTDLPGVGVYASLDEAEDALIKLKGVGAQPLHAVYSIHCLEHLRDPLAYLERYYCLVKPGGQLVIEVPNVLTPYGGLQSWFFQWPHLYDFSPATLAAFMLRAGWTQFEHMQVGGGRATSALVTRARKLTPRIQIDPGSACDAGGCEPGAKVAEFLRTYDLNERAGKAFSKWLSTEAPEGSEHALVKHAVTQALKQAQTAVQTLDTVTRYLTSAIEQAEARSEKADHTASEDPWQQGAVSGEAKADMAWMQVAGHALNVLRAASLENA